jgi:hypothetical protein
VDNAWELEKLEARKMLENGAESYQSAARGGGWRSLKRYTASSKIATINANDN